MSSLILKRAPIGDNQEDYSVLEDGAVIGRILFLDAVGPQGRPRMWASGHNCDYRRAAHGYEATREEAMQAFARSWHRQTRDRAPKQPHSRALLGAAEEIWVGRGWSTWQ